MLVDVLLLLAGGLGLYFGAEWLVLGASRLARAMGVPPLVIGLTIVSYGTSAPELAVSVTAALSERSAIALGNVIGSNIANVGLILGITALIAPPSVGDSLVKREIPVLLLATAALPVVLLDGVIGRVEALVFFAGALVFTYAAFKWAGRAPQPEEDEVDGERKLGRAALGGIVALGLAVLTAGGQAFVSGAAGIAQELGMSERLVGLTVVAIGTSLPELAASLVAALRGHSELAVGNVVGSNLFNILLVLGATSLVHPIAGELGTYAMDLAFMGGLTLLCVFSMRGQRRIGRLEGTIYVATYAAFILALIATR